MRPAAEVFRSEQVGERSLAPHVNPGQPGDGGRQQPKIVSDLGPHLGGREFERLCDMASKPASLSLGVDTVMLVQRPACCGEQRGVPGASSRQLL